MPCKVRENGRKEGNKAKENQAIQFKGNSLPKISAEVKPIETRQEVAKGEGM